MQNTSTRRYATAAGRTHGRPVELSRRSSSAGMALSQLSDEQLFALYQAGNEGAFTQIMQRYEPLIKGFLHKRLKDEERVRDLTQDTFLRVHRARDRYDSARKFSTW